jgi:hypothetical protein
MIGATFHDFRLALRGMTRRPGYAAIAILTLAPRHRRDHSDSRLRDRVSAAAAQQDLSTIVRRLKQQYGRDEHMVDASARPVIEQLAGNVRTRPCATRAGSESWKTLACARKGHAVRRATHDLGRFRSAARRVITRSCSSRLPDSERLGRPRGIFHAARQKRVFAISKRPTADCMQSLTSLHTNPYPLVRLTRF